MSSGTYVQEGERRKLYSLQAGRALAALFVCLHHSSVSSRAFVGEPSQKLSWLDFVLNNDLRVDFFFPLSGFVIYYIHRNDARTTTAAWTYIKKRFVRIYTPYWPIALLTVLLYTLLPNVSASDRSWDIVSSFLLWPSYEKPVVPHAWTLVFEMLFYLVFLLYFLPFRRSVLFWSYLAVCMSYLLVGEAWPGQEFMTPLYRHLFSVYSLEIAAGIAAAVLLTKLPLKAGKPLFFLALVAVLPAARIASLWSSWRFLLGMVFAVMILAVVLIEHQQELGIPRWVSHLGDASFAIFLVHGLVVSVVSRICQRVPFLGSYLTNLVLCLAVSIVCGLIYHHLVERPALAKTRSIILRPQRRD